MEFATGSTDTTPWGSLGVRCFCFLQYSVACPVLPMANLLFTDRYKTSRIRSLLHLETPLVALCHPGRGWRDDSLAIGRSGNHT